MIHRCQIQRDANAVYNDTKSYTPLGTPVPCYLWATAGKEAVQPGNVEVVEDLRAILPLGTDITTLDVIQGVTNRAGAVIEPRLLEVQTLLARADHVEAVLMVISG